MKFYLKLTLVILIGAILIGTYLEFFATKTGGDQVIITVASGSNFSTVSKQLKDNEVISSELLFSTFAKWKRLDTKIHAGVFELQKGLSYTQILDLLTDPKTSAKKLLIKEGEDIYSLSDKLIELGVITTSDELFSVIGYPARLDNVKSKFEYELLVEIPNGLSYEGYIFPDTYNITATSGLNVVLNQIFTNFERKVSLLLETHNFSVGMNLHEVLTLASIVNKEGKSLADKKMVAGVFINRLKIGMGLQSDPTVNYITRKITDNPSLDDIGVDSPYNTYKYRGLPPGPISNPGVDDIIAVLEATSHNYFYFINTKEGEMIYSRTFAEHVANRIKYGQ